MEEEVRTAKEDVWVKVEGHGKGKVEGHGTVSSSSTKAISIRTSQASKGSFAMPTKGDASAGCVVTAGTPFLPSSGPVVSYAVPCKGSLSNARGDDGKWQKATDIDDLMRGGTWWTAKTLSEVIGLSEQGTRDKLKAPGLVSFTDPTHPRRRFFRKPWVPPTFEQHPPQQLSKRSTPMDILAHLKSFKVFNFKDYYCYATNTERLIMAQLSQNAGDAASVCVIYNFAAHYKCNPALPGWGAKLLADVVRAETSIPTKEWIMSVLHSRGCYNNIFEYLLELGKTLSTEFDTWHLQQDIDNELDRLVKISGNGIGVKVKAMFKTVMSGESRGEAHVDSHVLRVGSNILGDFTGIEDSTLLRHHNKGGAAKAQFGKLGAWLDELDGDDKGSLVYAMQIIGKTVCQKTVRRCGGCPLAQACNMANTGDHSEHITIDVEDMEDIGNGFSTNNNNLAPSHAALGGIAPGEGTWLPEFTHVLFDDGCDMTFELGSSAPRTYVLCKTVSTCVAKMNDEQVKKIFTGEVVFVTHKVKTKWVDGNRVETLVEVAASFTEDEVSALGGFAEFKKRKRKAP